MMRCRLTKSQRIVLRSALVAAAANGHDGTATALLEKKATPDLATPDHTALVAACLGEHAATVRLLLGSKADPDAPRPGHMIK